MKRAGLPIYRDTPISLINTADWITNISRYADLFDKYSQVFSDSTGFRGVSFHGRKIHKVDNKPLMFVGVKFLGG